MTTKKTIVWFYEPLSVKWCLFFFNMLSRFVTAFLPSGLTDVQAGFTKVRGTRDQIANICWIIKKARVPEKHLFLLYWLHQSPWLCGSQQTVENSSRDGNTRPPYLPPDKICMQVEKQQLELDMEKHTCSKLGKEYIKVVCCHPAYLTYMQSTSWEILG